MRCLPLVDHTQLTHEICPFARDRPQPPTPMRARLTLSSRILDTLVKANAHAYSHRSRYRLKTAALCSTLPSVYCGSYTG